MRPRAWGNPAAQGNQINRISNLERVNGLVLLDLESFSEPGMLSTTHKAPLQVACAATLVIPIEQLYSHIPATPPSSEPYSRFL